MRADIATFANRRIIAFAAITLLVVSMLVTVEAEPANATSGTCWSFAWPTSVSNETLYGAGYSECSLSSRFTEHTTAIQRNRAWGWGDVASSSWTGTPTNYRLTQASRSCATTTSTEYKVRAFSNFPSVAYSGAEYENCRV